MAQTWLHRLIQIFHDLFKIRSIAPEPLVSGDILLAFFLVQILAMVFVYSAKVVRKSIQLALVLIGLPEFPHTILVILCELAATKLLRLGELGELPEYPQDFSDLRVLFAEFKIHLQRLVLRLLQFLLKPFEVPPCVLQFLLKRKMFVVLLLEPLFELGYFCL